MATKTQSKTAAVPRNNLQRLRERHRPDGFWLTLAEMARVRGIDESLVSRHESGQRGMSQQDVVEYAKILKVNPIEIFPGLTVDEPVASKR